MPRKISRWPGVTGRKESIRRALENIGDKSRAPSETLGRLTLSKSRPMSTETQLATTEEQKPARVPISMGTHGVSFQSYDELGRFCLAVQQSGLAPKSFSTPQAIMVAIQHGLELGLAPMQALQSIAVINGRPSLWGDAALALATAHPDFEDINEEATDTEATCTIKRKGRSPVVRKFSVDDAKKAGLWAKAGPWSQYPKRMLQMRARSFALRDSFPDALRGVAIREEQEDIPVAKARVVETASIKFADEPKHEPRETLALEVGQ
jgi:hypothetical protein